MSHSYNAGTSSCLLYSIPFTMEATTVVNEDGWQTYNSMCGKCAEAHDYFYKRDLNMCYHLESEVPKNITNAIVFCYGCGRMLRINTAEKQAHIGAFLNSQPTHLVYIGGFSEQHDDLFSYEDGTPLTTFFWAPHGQPHQEYSIRLKKNKFLWINNPGTTLRRFLCETSP